MAAHNPSQSILSAIYSILIGVVVAGAVLYDYLFKITSLLDIQYYHQVHISKFFFTLDVRYIAYLILFIYSISMIRSVPRHLKQYKARKFGVNAETKWFRILKQSCGNGFKVWKDPFFFKGIGDIDSIIAYKGKVYVIEIKSHFVIRINQSNSGILNKENMPFKKDFIKQSYDISNAYFNKNNVVNYPILWFPNSKGNTTIINGVVIVRGNQNVLLSLISSGKI